MDISNKALAMFLLAAIVVSLGGTIVSLNKLDTVSTTGYATSDQGIAQLNVSESLSIILDYDSIDFGACTLGEGVPINITSEDTLNTSAFCSSFDANPFAIRNNGNVAANVTVNVSDVGTADGGTFLSPGTNSVVRYEVTSGGDGSNTDGCTGEGPASYTDIEATGTKYAVCDSLAAVAAPGANSVLVNVNFEVPNDSPTGVASLTYEFIAHTV